MKHYIKWLKQLQRIFWSHQKGGQTASLVTGFILRNLRGIPTQPENARGAPGAKVLNILEPLLITTNVFIHLLITTTTTTIIIIIITTITTIILITLDIVITSEKNCTSSFSSASLVKNSQEVASLLITSKLLYLTHNLGAYLQISAELWLSMIYATRSC